MKTLTLPTTNWIELAHELGKNFADRAAAVDKAGTFVEENYADLKAHRFFSAMVPHRIWWGRTKS